MMAVAPPLINKYILTLNLLACVSHSFLILNSKILNDQFIDRNQITAVKHCLTGWLVGLLVGCRFKSNSHMRNLGLQVEWPPCGGGVFLRFPAELYVREFEKTTLNIEDIGRQVRRGIEDAGNGFDDKQFFLRFCQKPYI